MLNKKHFQILAKSFSYHFSFEESKTQNFYDKLEFFMDVLSQTNSDFNREIFKKFVHKNL